MNRFSVEAFFIFLIYLKPGVIEDIAILDALWNAFRFGGAIMILALHMIRKQGKEAYVRLAPLILLFVLALNATWAYSGAMRIILRNYVAAIGLIGWLEFRKKRMQEIVVCLFLYAFAMLSLNFISILLFPQGLFRRPPGVAWGIRVWILGQKQDFVQYVLPALLCGMITNELYPTMKRMFKILIVEVAITLCLTKPVGLALACIVIAAMELSRKFWNKKFFFSKIYVFPWIFALALLVVAKNYQSLTLLHELLGLISIGGVSKSWTMGKRFAMWDFITSPLNKNWLIGMGNLAEKEFLAASGLDFYHTHMHNMYVDILYNGGILSLLMFLFWQWQIARRLYERRGLPFIAHMAEVYFSISVLFLTECLYLPSIIFCYMLVYWYQYLFPLEPVFVRSNNMRTHNSHIYIYMRRNGHYFGYFHIIRKIKRRVLSASPLIKGR